jgi:environmental stress-induced protein Ves
VVPWANGQGTTSVVARRPDDEQWVWRLSLADVTVDGPFSALPGIARSIAVASGAGMELMVDDAPPVRLTTASAPFEFDGGAAVTCHLIDGPIFDVNLMVRRGHATGTMIVHELHGGEQLQLTPDTTACVVLAGSIGVDVDVLGRFDAIIGPGAELLHALDDARVAVVHIG